MNKQELLSKLQKYEWNGLEFKKAQSGVSKSAYETASAFANTSGGYLIFGVAKVKGGFEVVGVKEVDKVQNEFLSGLRNKDLLSYQVEVEESVVEVDGKIVLSFKIAEAERVEKPVYLKGNIRKSYIRKGDWKSIEGNFPHLEVKYLRHPSFGGKKEFSEGIARYNLTSWCFDE